MDVETGSPGDPRLHLGVFVGAVVVDDEMDIQGFGHVGVDVPQEGEELLVPEENGAAGVSINSWLVIGPGESASWSDMYLLITQKADKGS